MADIKSRVIGMNPNCGAKDISEFIDRTGNIYEALAIISKRANQLNVEVKHELADKLEEFATHSDSIEEIHENKEQIEISKYYERMPNSAIIGMNEFLEDKLDYSERRKSDA